VNLAPSSRAAKKLEKSNFVPFLAMKPIPSPPASDIWTMFRVGRVGPVDPAAGEIDVAEVGVAEVRACEVGLQQLGPHVRASDLGAGERGPDQIAFGQVGVGNDRLVAAVAQPDSSRLAGLQLP